ncbi:Re/Si-specific NAD(P)(+) transhydrogenase subunit alpha [Knoellia sp. 3-2P3]|uniref:Re/Si-specific NAD(P)(+) transhydrogenase subunit alpha n=1 Tax=unclassified Knoellia TaxID=2618719 RepID=UPI0023DA5EC4|nr:Re/Si-specific NAD(P)(+) transhydrogenase subunit alpha [Knoellia sp. 3-2P3]MDF2091018.1 Re/Si-specific NAD(P)(+) transhydrogenase subunit alpha [Knoellia sp. 3-2P3]
MRIGVPKESRPGETRVAATPKTVGQLIGLGYEVVVEAGAGQRSSFSDAAFQEAGAAVGGHDEAWDSDVVIKVNAPTDEEIARLRPGAVLASLLAPALNPELVDRLAAQGVTALAMDAVPRISRAQALDVLSSMANIGGYRAVVEAAHEFGSLFTGQVTAAGKVPPAKVLVIGAGVAGLAAIGTANSLGAIVRAFDARPEVAEQVESMGAEFLRIEGLEQEGPSATGYAKEMGEDFNRRAAELYAEQAGDVDIIITTALIPGKPAPRLITKEMVASMRPGSVIVDMAAANGGNVEGTVADQLVVTDNQVRIIGYTDLPGRLPTQASQLYGTNLVNLLKLLTPEKDGKAVVDFDDVVQRGMTVCRDGQSTWPPPPVAVSAAPAAAPVAEKSAPPPPKVRDPRRRYALMGLAAVIFGLVAAWSPATFLGHFTVFALAVIVGFYVISNVAHALHTPLMSETNAISGIILVGALLQIGSEDPVVRTLAFVATVIASINIFGGFAVTNRMLQMFRKD